MSRQEDLEKEMTLWQRRLQQRKEQKAIMGISADPSIDIEIEDIEAKLNQLQTELAALTPGRPTRPSIGDRPGPVIDKTALRKTIVARYGLSQVKTLCEDCGVDYEQLGETALEPLVRELIRELERRGQLDILVEKVREP